MRNALLGMTVAGVVLALTAANASPVPSILVLNGTGASNLVTPLTAAGFNVISDAFNPGVIAGHLSAPNNIKEIWVWNDGTFGNTGSPVDPSRAFNSADLAALHIFNATHDKWIMDGLSWRGANTDEMNLDANEAINLANAGGGIVLGADDASGAAIIQHVNQVASSFGFNDFFGVFVTPPSSEQTGGLFLSAPNAVNPINVVGTTTYSELPHGMQPNGIFMSTAIFGIGTDYCPAYYCGPLPSDTFNGVTYDHVNHLVTTNIPGGGINNPDVPEPSTMALFGGMLLLGALRRRRKQE